MSERLVVIDGALGDVVLRLPALRAVAQRWGAPQVWAPGRWCGVLEELGLASRAQRLDRAELGPLRGAAPEEASGALAGVTRALLLSGDEGLAAGLRALGVAADVVARDPPPGVHQAAWAWRGAAAWHGQAPIEDPRELPLPLAPLPAAWRAPESSAGVLLFPGSGGLQKCWPAARYGALAEALVAQGVAVGVVLGPDELERGWARGGYAGAQVFEAPGLRATAALAAGASLVVGNDAGTSHLAAAAGAATLTLFGPTSPGRWRPMGPRARALGPEALRALPVDRVLGEVMAYWTQMHALVQPRG